MKILLTGAQGQVGRCFQDEILAQANALVSCMAFSSAQLDITNKAQVDSVVSDVRPHFIVNAAAYTAVDQAEGDVDAAYNVNELGVKNLAEAAKSIGAVIIHISTDYVFDGNETIPYSPCMQANPESVYGQSKLAGEVACKLANKKHVILRTAWVFSEYGNNFVKTMIRLAKTRNELSIVADQYGCPTYAGDIAAAILNICTELSKGEEHFGVYHFCGDSPTSWHGFARAIFADAQKCELISKEPVLRVLNTDEYPTPAKRPAYSVLDSSKVAAVFSIDAPKWRLSLRRVVAHLNKVEPF